MRVVYMGKNKLSAVEGLNYLVNKGVEVIAVVAPPRGEDTPVEESLFDASDKLGIPVATDVELYAGLTGESDASKYDLTNVDLVISFLFWKRIKKPLIDLPRIGCINFHPAPLPDVRGVAVYSIAVYEKLSSWGVSAHFVDECFDTGDIIKVLRFDIDPNNETAFSLEARSQKVLLELFKQVIDAARDGSLPRIPQGEGRYVSKGDFEKLRKIQPEDTLEEIDKKIRAFWFPPHGGAFIEIQQKEFTIVNEKLLSEIASAVKKGRA
jgi:methionyl-tRNA formyltransferase